MESKLAISVMCVTVMHSSLAMLTSPGSQIQMESSMTDFSIMAAYQAIAVFLSEKTVLGIHNIIGDRVDSFNEDSQAMKTCDVEILAPFIAASDAVLAAIQVADTGASPAVTDTRITCVSKLTELVENICSAVELAWAKNSSEVFAEIQVIAHKQISDIVTLNVAIFAAIRNGRDGYKVNSVIESALKKATQELTSAVFNIFEGISTLALFETQDEKQNVFSAIEITLKRAFSSITIDLNIKFELIKTLFMASSIIQFGIVADSSVIQTIEDSVFSDYEKLVQEDWPSCIKKDKSEVVNDYPSEMINKKCDCGATRKTANLKILKLKDNELAKGHLKKENECGNDSFERAKATTVANYLGCVKANLNAMLVINPNASSAIRVALLVAESQVKKAVDDIYDAIILIKEKDSSKSLAKLQALEDGTIYVASAAIKSLFDKNLLGEIPAQILTEMENAHQETMSQLKNECRAIFKGFRIRMAEISAGTHCESKSKSHTSAFENARAEASAAVKTMVQIRFDAIETFCKVSVEDQVTLTANLSAIRYYRHKAMLKITKAIDLVFNDILAFTEESPSDKNIPINNFSNI